MATTSETPTKRRKTTAAADADTAQEQSITEAWNAGDDFASAPAIEEEAAAPKRTRKKKTDEPVAETAPTTEEDAVEAVAVEAKPKRTRKKATEETPEAVEVTAEEPVEAAAEPVAEAAPVVEEAEKPKRSRKKAETDEAPKSLIEIASEKPSTQAADAAPQVAQVEEIQEETPVTFADLGMSDSLMKSITAVGYEEPTPIQLSTIPLLLEGHDVIAQAQTGSGKTAAFGLPIIEAVNPKQRNVQALILAPTRELAIQVSEALHKYGRHKEVETLPIYGGQPYERQFRGLQRGPQIVVGTPGRVMDHMRRQTLDLSHIKFFILDEADEMLDMGFIEDIEWILEQVPTERQTALFSATMPPRIVQLASRYLNNPERISVASKQMTVPEVTQAFYEVPRNRKIDALTRILDAEVPSLAMIFCRTKMMVDELGEALMARGYSAETLHGDLSQAQRDRVMRRFRTGQADILIATDVAARGLDIPDVSHVINYDIPESPETYVHRIGRTGRAGKTGVAITLVTAREVRWIRQIERAVKARIEPRRLPTVADVAERRVEQLKNQITSALGDEVAPALAWYVSAVEAMAEEYELSTIAAAALRLYAEETGRGQIEEQVDDVAVIAIQSGAPRDRGDRFDRGQGRDDRRGPRSFEPSEGKVRLFMNVGHNLGIRPQDIVGAIANEANIPGRTIGSIDIFDGYSFVEVPSDDSQRIIDALSQSGIKGKYVNVEVARPDAGPGQRRDRFDRGDRGDRFDRGGGGYRGDRGGERRFDRPEPGNWRGRDNDRDRGPRPPFDRDRAPARRDFEDRAPRFDRDDRAPRFDRDERAPRFDQDRAPRFERDNDRGNRFDRPDRGNRFERSDRPRNPGRPDRDRF
ncbi:MAG TPA: DEAD/DEAH box helicase [Thermomicrobiales bacterium]|nr:DEAD/DEAH box helicase [Thermomicrobiales bacterium]